MKLVRPLVILCALAITSCTHGAAVTPVTVPGASGVSLVAHPDTLHVVPFFEFQGGPKGYTPLGTPGGRRGLVGRGTVMYGSTPAGGDISCAAGNGKGCGVIYELTPQSGSSMYAETVLLTFTGSNGAVPYASVEFGPNGDLYGTTFYGGQYNGGTVFVLQPSGSGYTSSIVHSFGNATDGAHPFAGVIYVNGVLYGTTIAGGTHTSRLCKVKGGSPDGTCGTVYRIDVATGAERVLHSFGAESDGATPYAGVIDANGTLIGTTVLGGSASAYCGTVYSLAPSGKERVVYSFGGSPDGCKSYGGLVERNGYVYGTTGQGGGNFGPSREGTVFRVNVASGVEQVLHEFGKDADGSEPEAAVVRVNGKLYGTTSLGGGSSHCNHGCGTVFSIDPTGANYKKLLTFDDDRAGKNPTDRLRSSAGSFYGTTSAGGKNGFGAGFKFTP